MPLETETVTGNPESPQQNNEETQKDDSSASEISETRPEEIQVSLSNDSQPLVQEDACILKQDVKLVEEHLQACSLSPRSTPKSPVAEATEDFLLNEKDAYDSEPVVTGQSSTAEPLTPTNSEASENDVSAEQSPSAPQIVDVSVYSSADTSAEETVAVTVNGHTSGEIVDSEPEQPKSPESQLTNGHSNGVCNFELKNVSAEVEAEQEVFDDKGRVINGTIANELIAEDYKLPDVVEVKKNFEHVQRSGNHISSPAPPKKSALSTSLDSQSVREAYQDVRNDGSETQWAVFKFEGPQIVTSATGTEFTQFKSQFGDDERAFGYIRVQTGDEMSKRAKFLLITWVGPSVSVLKRAKMSTDKALIKDVLSNFAVELQTENITDIDLQNFETELDKAAGAHYGTGVRS